MSLIELTSYPINLVLEKLLQDKTTGRHIIFATDAYSHIDKSLTANRHITVDLLSKIGYTSIQPRVKKSMSEQSKRTRTKAEVFTPSWVCNKMNNYCDEEWFGRKEVFNREVGNGWEVKKEPITFANPEDWMRYVYSRRLEITCGEAPYIVSRYDAATGEDIAVPNRIGILDRKLRVINENVKKREEWFKWVKKAYESVYGYEYQGDNLLIARINLIETFVDYTKDRWGTLPTKSELSSIVNRIVWNFWQMDGLTGRVPGGYESFVEVQGNLFSDVLLIEKALDCKTYQWRSKKQVYLSIGVGKIMKFDYVIGNPPYQEGNDNNNRKSPIYHCFFEAAEKLSDVIELITPARFLFDAGQTPKEWNNKMLNSQHVKVLEYVEDGSTVFPNTDIKGGVGITIINKNKIYNVIGTFTPQPILSEIVNKVTQESSSNLASLAHSKSYYGFTKTLYEDFPEFTNRLTKGNEYILDANIFEKIPEIFEITKEAGLLVHGRLDGNRVIKVIKKDYIKEVDGISKYKVFVAGANGRGAFGEVLSTPFIGKANEIGTQTYMSFGFFDFELEAEACLKYIKSKFARCLLGVLKVTQNNPKNTWSKIPLQDFTSNSDIDWSKSIVEIDQQLYKKYNLSPEEIEFIESKVKEMV